MNNNEDIYYFWIVEDDVVPDRIPDGEIRDCNGFFQMNNSHKPYDTYESAYKALLKSFKRKGIYIYI